jgi:catechol 2,3-dioxygenase-like lactoylglutathione lyase family enzyme
MPVVGMNHFTVLAKDLEATKDFYLGVLGLVEGYRPNLGFPGAWLYVGDAAVLHVVAGRALPADPPGRA